MRQNPTLIRYKKFFHSACSLIKKHLYNKLLFVFKPKTIHPCKKIKILSRDNVAFKSSIFLSGMTNSNIIAETKKCRFEFLKMIAEVISHFNENIFENGCTERGTPLKLRATLLTVRRTLQSYVKYLC